MHFVNRHNLTKLGIILENVKICPKLISGKKYTSGGNIQN